MGVKEGFFVFCFALFFKDGEYVFVLLGITEQTGKNG